MRLIPARTFQKSVDRLDAQSQNLIKTTVMDLCLDLASQGKPRPGLRFHKLDRTVRDPGIRSVSASPDLRVILHQTGETYVLLYAHHHDAAYDWAARRRLQPNPETGAMQLVDIEEVTQIVTRQVTQTQTFLFREYEPRYLMSLGVPEAYVEAVRHATEENFDPLFEVLPEEASERLLALMDGELVLPPMPVPAGGDPFDHPDAQRHFQVTTDEAELQAALNGRWEEWMIYLHPAQRHLAERRQSGPARVTGSAGTGKTVVALHRTAHLARQHPQARVLLTSFSRTLSSRLDEKLALLLPDDRQRAQVTVMNLHRLASRLGRQWSLPHRLLADEELTGALTRAARAVASDLPLAFLRAEWQAVVEPRGLRTWDEYRAAPRTGRGVALGARQRLAIWKVFEALQAELRRQGQTTWGLLCHDVADALATQGPPFDHAVVDEAQDLGPAELRLLRALVAAGPDDLFLCADPAQRIFRARSSWLSSGIDVRGRASRLKINYRTSGEIRQFADRVLGEVRSEEDLPEARRTINRFSGPRPDVRRFDTRQAELDGVSRWIQARLGEGLRAGEVAVFTRARSATREDALLRLLGTDIQTLEADMPHQLDRLTVTTMHRAKGLEFRAVVLMDAGADVLPSPAALQDVQDPADREAVLEQERQLLYVAATRAREQLLITHVGAASPFIQAEP
ncbi:3'-5' exonuclease [Deinococcus arcticus]|uniref:DNA 3'-5' helicase n=1 Tax=Deinococcus arcticus TaxID=2136176 RepID=A0A2T3W4W1_9DEIO|nr:3'-5' exonuclease [Deinococcus arcticus]PTA66912.1 DNA helicase [Deinococcus arcticus]